MPDVTVRYNRFRYNITTDLHLISDMVLLELREELPAIVAEYLSIPIAGGMLTSSDIELNFHKYGTLDVHGEYVIQIIVDANLYRKRSANIDERTKGIKDAIALLPNFAKLKLKDGEWFVWVRLHKASFR